MQPTVRHWIVRCLAGTVLFGVITGCGAGIRSSEELYELSNLRVVFLDEPQIQAKWKEVTGTPAVMMTPRLVMESQRRQEVVVGFYDWQTRTIYCPKMNFEVCGHELHHAVLGRFHLER
jgi:acetoacetate decarboxylase